MVSLGIKMIVIKKMITAMVILIMIKVVGDNYDQYKNDNNTDDDDKVNCNIIDYYKNNMIIAYDSYFGFFLPNFSYQFSQIRQYKGG